MLFLARGRVSLPSMRSRQLSEKRPLISHIHNFFHCGSKISFSSCDTFKSWCVINILGITITLTAWLGIITISIAHAQFTIQRFVSPASSLFFFELYKSAKNFSYAPAKCDFKILFKSIGHTFAHKWILMWNAVQLLLWSFMRRYCEKIECQVHCILRN